MIRFVLGRRILRGRNEWRRSRILQSSSNQGMFCTRSLSWRMQKSGLARFYESHRSMNLSLSFILSSYNLPRIMHHAFRGYSWEKGRKYWWSWWEKIVKSVNRRCLLCAGAIFLWDRERVTNQEVSRSLSKYEKRVSGKLFNSDSPKKVCSDDSRNEQIESGSHNQSSVASGAKDEESSCDQHSKHSNEPEKQKKAARKPNNRQVKPKSNNQCSSSVSSKKNPKRNQSEKEKAKKLSGNSSKSKKKAESTCISEKEKEDKNEEMSIVNQNEGQVANDLRKESQVVSDDDLVNQEDPLKDWRVMSEQECCTVYSKPYGDNGLYQYKVIGHYEDITARDFLDVQVNDDRKSWDTYCLSLKTVDRDSSTGSEIIHWVVKFPFPLSNRDYVFVRRHWISPDDDAIVMISRAVTHPSVPETRKNVRVKSYFSEMIIKPNTFIDELGFHYELTYFDDPGGSIPSTAMSWASKTAMPDFLGKIYKAAVMKQASNEHKHLA